jgi:hypothetical protein
MHPGLWLTAALESRCGGSGASVLAPFPHPAHPTRQVDFRHKALGQSLKRPGAVAAAPPNAAMKSRRRTESGHRLSRLGSHENRVIQVAGVFAAVLESALGPARRSRVGQPDAIRGHPDMPSQLLICCP